MFFVYLGIIEVSYNCFQHHIILWFNNTEGPNISHISLLHKHVLFYVDNIDEPVERNLHIESKTRTITSFEKPKHKESYLVHGKKIHISFLAYFILNLAHLSYC